MADPNRDSEGQTSPTGWAEVNADLDRLKDKTDEQSNQRRLELLDQLLGMDMGMQPSRRAMGQPKQVE
jgi:hypothetical protein